MVAAAGGVAGGQRFAGVIQYFFEMKNYSITIRHSIFVRKKPETVWDFTQDYNLRPKWDNSVLEAQLVQTTPYRTVHLTMKGSTTMTLVYKLDDRPHKTTLAAKEVVSPMIASAGGSWAYLEKDGGTVWTQTNTIVLKNKLLLLCLKPFLRWGFKRQTKESMSHAKKLMEEL